MDAKRYADLRADGWTRGELEYAVSAGTLRPVARGTLLAGPGQPTIVDTLRALLLVLPAAAMIGFHTAAELYGSGAPPSRRPHIVVPAGTPVPDLRAVAASISPAPAGGWTRSRSSTRRCAPGRCTPGSLATELLRHDGLRGVRQARELVPLADRRAECRQESQLRLVLIDGRLAAPEPQLWVTDEWGRTAVPARSRLRGAEGRRGVRRDLAPGPGPDADGPAAPQLARVTGLGDALLHRPRPPSIKEITSPICPVPA
jgi:hypothetical protein